MEVMRQIRKPSTPASFDKFLVTGSFHKQSGGALESDSDEIEQIRHALQINPTKLVRQASKDLQVPRMTSHRVLRKRLHLFAYKGQII